MHDTPTLPNGRALAHRPPEAAKPLTIACPNGVSVTITGAESQEPAVIARSVNYAGKLTRKAVRAGLTAELFQSLLHASAEAARLEKAGMEARNRAQLLLGGKRVRKPPAAGGEPAPTDAPPQ